MDNGPDEFCPGCTPFTKNVPDLAGLADNGVGWVTVSNMPLARIEALQGQVGWTLPFVSSRGTPFPDDCGAVGGFMLSPLLRDGEDIYRTYSSAARGVDRVLFVNNILTSPRTDARKTGRTRRPAGRRTSPTGSGRPADAMAPGGTGHRARRGRLPSPQPAASPSAAGPRCPAPGGRR